MGCEICGRNSCVKSFHSIEEQDEYDGVADKIKDKMRGILTRRMNSLPCSENEEEAYIKLEDAISIIEDVL